MEIEFEIHGFGEFWEKVKIAVWGPKTGLLNFLLGQNDSLIWRSIWKGKTIQFLQTDSPHQEFRKNMKLNKNWTFEKIGGTRKFRKP